MADHASVPPTITASADPNVLLDLSVEWPVIAAAYGDNTPASCRHTDANSEVNSLCYDSTEEYLGYFDADKCYAYDTTNNYFYPSGTATDHQCSNAWSGNLLNWATMSSLDIIRHALSGGHRSTDSSSLTVLQRAMLDSHMNNGTPQFPVKRISSTDNVDPTTVMPGTIGTGSVSSSSTVYLVSYDNRVKICSNSNCGTTWADYYARVKVCDSSAGLEDNCAGYPNGNYKPHGLIQNNSTKMRFGLMSYLQDTDVERDGGVLRARMKYVGPYMPASGGGLVANPNAEWGENDGVFVVNPDPTDASNTATVVGSAIPNSGVINYLNKFGSNGAYKSKDPVSEIFYECIRYYKGANLAVNPQTATTEYANNLTAAFADGFPVITSWNDPILHQCQNNFILAINDAFPHRDKSLPGTFFTNATISGTDISVDYGEPSNPDSTINVRTLTNTVGVLENSFGGFNLSNFLVGCKQGDCDESCNNKSDVNLGEVMGTCPPSGGRENSYYAAGLAYYANTQDIRSDFAGDQTIKTFMIDVQEYNSNPPTGAMNPLWLVGKYGGFEETDNTDSNSDGNSKEPNLAAEWDKDGDGEADNYVLANQPDAIVNGLSRAFSSIVQRVSAGSAAAVISNSTSGTGTIIQALYQPRVDINNKQIQWAGRLHSVFLDERNHLREDTNQNRTLDAYGTDNIIKILYDTSVGRTRIFICDTTDNGITVTCDPSNPSKVKEIDDLKTLWNARDQLAAISNANIPTQRTYGTADGKRYIFTWLDDGNNTAGDNGQVESGEVKAFVAASFNNANEYSQFNLPSTGVGSDGDNTLSATDARDLINFIRGQEGLTGFRPRSIDYDNDGTDEAWRLGDIIHSTPVALEAPNADWDIKYGDTTYAAFRQQYAKRRQVVYVGGNDGMVHAFNGGFLDPINKVYELTRTAESHESGAPASHALGAELWAYVPKNLLPHLQWLKELNYPHVYYVDGNVQTFDVNIFPADTTHPNGWGTILVATMRFGGNPVTYDHDNNGSTANITTRSAVMIFDVTDPELAPKLLAEFTDSDLGFTTSDPTLWHGRVPDINGDWGTPSANVWGLLFGSGPNHLGEAKSTQNGHLYTITLAYNSTNGALDLTTAGNVGEIDMTDSADTNFSGYDANATNSFVGHPNAVDWDNDYVTDTIYFGLVKNDIANQTGKLKRLSLGVSPVLLSDIITQGQPFPNKPQTIRNVQGQWWVYAGTGRLYVNADNSTTVQQSYYGVKEVLTAAKGTSTESYAQADLVDTGGITVDSAGALGGTGIPTGLTTFNQLVAYMNQATVKGWYNNFNVSNPNERNLSGTTVFDDLLLFTTYKPPTDACLPEGGSSLYALYYKTGTAHPTKGLVQAIDVFNSGSGVGSPVDQVDLGLGLAAQPVMYRGIGAGRARPIIQTSTGEIVEGFEFQGSVVRGRQSWREIFTD